jgi:hypothetical protein
MARDFDEEYDEDTDFNPEDFDDSEITDLSQLWEFANYDEGDFVEYEFHGTGDTGGET